MNNEIIIKIDYKKFLYERGVLHLEGVIKQGDFSSGFRDICTAPCRLSRWLSRISAYSLFAPVMAPDHIHALPTDDSA